MPIDDFEQVKSDLRAIPREVRRDLTPVLKQAGEGAAADARGRAAWSSRIPGAIRVVVRYGQRRPGVAIRVSARRAPHARAYEGKGTPGNFRHPLFGDREHWISEAQRPFAFPAVKAKRDEAQRGVDQVVMSAARRHGFH